MKSTLTLHCTRLLFLCCLLALPGFPADSQERSGDAPKEKNKETSEREWLQDYHDEWLEQDVVYIITEEERAVFLALTTDEERDHFIEQFWRRRDHDPRSSINETKEEHYRRIQYANDRFAAGIPGWKTDRGRIYIMFGPPDRIESYPTGGSYDRKPHEGGGRTSVYPFERWEYRYIEGVGEDVELEFVDQSGGNLYRLSMDPQDKDELLMVPGMGLNDAEVMWGRKSPFRVNRIRESGLADKQGIYFERAKDQPFQKAELLMKLSKAPMIRFDDLKALVRTRIRYEQFPFKVASHYFRIDPETYLVSVTILLDNRELSFQQGHGFRQSRVQVYGLVSTITRRVVFEFDEEIAADYRPEQIEGGWTRHGAHQRKFILPPVRYKLDLIVKDTVSGRMGTVAIPIRVPSRAQQQLSTSSLVLTKEIQPSEAGISEAFVVGRYKITPQVDPVFHADDYLGFYFETYGFEIDQSAREPNLEIKYAHTPRGRPPRSFKSVTGGIGFLRDRVYVARMVQLHSLEEGEYELVCSISDTLSGQSVTQRAPFKVQ